MYDNVIKGNIVTNTTSSNGFAGTSIITSVTTGNLITSNIAAGAKGDTGPAGVGVPVGGTTGQVLAKINATDYNTQWVNQTGGGGGAVSSVAGRTGDVVLTKSDVSLSNVDNTSDANKPVSTAQQTAINNKVTDIPEVTLGTAGQLTINQSTVGTATGTYTAPTLSGSLTSPLPRFEFTNGNTSNVTLSFPNAAGTTINLTVLPGEIVTFRQTTLNGYRNVSGNKPLAQLDLRYEALSNKSTVTTLGTSDTLYPSQNAVKSYVDTVASTKQATGNYITALTGDGTASGPGSSALTLATVNSNTGSFGGAASVPAFSVNAKGLTTSVTPTAIQIAESQVTNLVSDLSGKQATLVSGTNIKTINGNSVLGSGDLVISGGGTGAAITRSIAQTGHGFTVGKLVYYNGTTYVTSDNTASSTAEVDGIVTTVTDANNFVITMRGYVTGLSALTANATYFLGTSGNITTTAPSTVGNVRKPVLHSDSTTTGYFNNYLGIAVAAPGGGSGITRSIQTVNVNTTLAATASVDYVYIFTAGTPTLPTAVGNTNLYTVKNQTGAPMTVSTTSGQTIDGGTITASNAIPAQGSLDFISDNSNWQLV